MNGCFSPGLVFALALALFADTARTQTLTVDAGPDQVVTSLQALPRLRLELRGSVSPSTASVSWEQIAGRNRPSFGQPRSPRTTVSFLESGPYALRLNATLGNQSASDTMRIHIVVPQVAADNLVANPWFRSASGNTGSMNKWTVGKGSWHATKKGHNPSPDTLGQTAADLDSRLANGQDTWIYQVLRANSLHTRLRFQMYWVTIMMVRVYARIQGASSATGPWTPIWTPFQVQNAHSKRWAQTGLSRQTLAKGHAYYRIELHGVLPKVGGATKYTGIYFATSLPGQGHASFTPFANGCAGQHKGSPVLQAKSGSRPILGRRFDLQLTNLPNTTVPPILLLGASAQRWGGLTLPLDLGPLGMPRCTLYVEAAIPMVLASSNWSAVVPDDSLLLGISLYNQAVVGGVVSNAGRAILGTY